jgi:predicted PurR-regulated permease PerM
MRKRSVVGTAGIGVYSTAVAAPSRDSRDHRPVREVDLDWRSVLVVLGAFVALIAVTGLVRSVPRMIAALAVAGILALALNPAVELVRRHTRAGRAPAVTLVLLGVAALFTVIGLLLVPPAVRQAQDLGRELPRVLSELGDLPVIGDDLVEADAPERLQNSIEKLPERLAGDTTPLEGAARRVADGLLAAVLTLLLAITLLLDGPRLVAGARRLVPVTRRQQGDRIAALAYRVVGHYVAGSLVVAAIAGLTVLVVGIVLGVPLTPLAAVWVALWDLVPQVGGAAGGIPFVLLGFTEGVATGVACGGIFVVYLQLENNVLQPLLVGQRVKLSPPATMTAALIGVSAGGVVGALLAVPLAGASKAVYMELRRPPQATDPVDA